MRIRYYLGEQKGLTEEGYLQMLAEREELEVIETDNSYDEIRECLKNPEVAVREIHVIPQIHAGEFPIVFKYWINDCALRRGRPIPIASRELTSESLAGIESRLELAAD